MQPKQPTAIRSHHGLSAHKSHALTRQTIETSPKTTEDLEALSASGKKIGLASNPFELIWTAGTQGAIAELSSPWKDKRRGQTYPAIRKWLQWLQQAALYQNISFHKDTHIRTDSHEVQRQRTRLGDMLGQPTSRTQTSNGEQTRRRPTPQWSNHKATTSFWLFWIFSRENSSSTQRRMAMKFIRTNVNPIAQRKLQLDNSRLAGHQ